MSRKVGKQPGEIAPIRKLLAENIERLRAAKGLSIPQVAKAGGFGEDPRGLRNIISCANDPQLTQVHKVAAGLEVPAWLLLLSEADREVLECLGVDKEARELVITWVRSGDKGREMLRTALSLAAAYLEHERSQKQPRVVELVDHSPKRKKP